MNKEYFEQLRDDLNKAYSLAEVARKKSLDPEDTVEVKITKDVAARVEGIVGPPGVAAIIRKMELEGMSRENVAFEIARKIAAGDIIKANKEFLIEQAVRTGVGILTEGVLVAPTEGIAKVKIKQNPDGTDYVAVYYAGPIRSAGGTAAALSLVLADVARKELKINNYRATDSQIERYIEEINMYEARVTHLQYKPPDGDIRTIIQGCPICVDGEPTEDLEVSAYRGVPGVETNRIRGGVPLVVCEGVAQKAAKLFKYTKKLNLGWSFLEKVIKIKKKADKIEIKPDDSYLDGLVAGRPVFAHASAAGAFRLRYGRSETTGIMSKNIHPATMLLLDNFLAYGTHMKIERPGKGCVVAGHPFLEPPVVRLVDGSVIKVKTLEKAEKVKSDVSEILFLGDMLISYGDFLKSNHPLIPSGYCKEWWEAEVKAKGITPPQTLDALTAFNFSKTHSVPLHPDYTFHWHDASSEDLEFLSNWFSTGTLTFDENKLREFSLPKSEEKKVLEKLLVEHRVVDNKIILEVDNAYSLLLSMGILDKQSINVDNFKKLFTKEKSPLQLVNELSGVKIKAKAPTYIGARMGRPEKAKERKMDGSPHVMFPTGSMKNRSLSKLYRTMKTKDGTKNVNLYLVRFRCKNCNSITPYRRCSVCNELASLENVCTECGRSVQSEEHCGKKPLPFDKRPINLVDIFDNLRAKLGFTPEEIKGVKGLSNALRIPEHLEKGFLRAKHDVYVFRDGTSRFDATDVTLTHFALNQAGLSLEKAKELGYTLDHLGNPLTDETQIVPLKCQDIVLSSAGAKYFFKVSKFIDELLINMYGLKPFYNLKSSDDLIGHLCVGLSPHTSAGVLCRVVGFTKANVGYGHPYFHTAKRRNCFYPDTEIIIWNENSKRYARDTLGTITDKMFQMYPTKIRDLDSSSQRVEIPNNLFVFSIDPKTNKIIRKKIKYFIKTNPPKNWIKLTTTTNRTMIVTPDHNILYINNGKLKYTEARNLKSGMNIPICSNLKSEVININSINLLKEFCSLEKKEKHSIMIRNIEFFKDLYYKNSSKIKKIFPKLKTNMPNSWYRSISLSDFELLVKNSLCNFDDLDDDTRIAMKRDDFTLPVKIPINHDLMLILGYFVSEGYARKSKSCYQINFRICNNQMLSKLLKAIKNVFGKKPYLGENDTQICLCSRIVHTLFTRIFGMGNSARTKRVPNLIFSLNNELVKSFISSYFDGDGSVVAVPPRIQFYSISIKLLEDISTLLLRFGIFGRYSTPKKPRLPGKKILERYTELGKPPKTSIVNSLVLYGIDIYKFSKVCTPTVKKKFERIMHLRKNKPRKLLRSIKYENSIVSVNHKSNYIFDKIKSLETFSENKPAYCLDISGKSLIEKNVLLNNQIFTIRCDGDEDCLILLMDALLNFSRKYLNEKRGGTMDAPLVLTPQINPKEVDDEVHCMEVVNSYPLEFYQAAEKITAPGDVKLKTVADILGKPEQYEQLPLTHPGCFLDKGNHRTAYVTLDSIPEKIAVEFALHDRLRPVDKKNAAERLILSHFIPDLYGNLRSFSRQTFRCVNCNTIYRRPPLVGKCNKCGGNLLLTINKGGIQKYLEISKKMVLDYGLPDYLKQRLELLEKEINSIFEDDKIKQTGLADFL